MADTAVGYTRLSQQSDTSIDRQKQHIRAYADEHGFDVDRIYDDGQGASGFESAREEYRELRDRVETTDEIDAIIVNDKRRLARDVDEVMRLIPDLRQNSTELHTCRDGQLDLSDAMRAAIEILQAAAAHEEKMEEIEKSIEAVEERLSAGYDHGPPRFGMRYREDGQYQEPADNFEKVEKIWRLREDGCSYSEIEEETEVPSSTAQRVVENRDWYLEREQMAQLTDF